MKLIALMKKEFLRFFKDPKLLATMLLPGILIYVLYSVMGSAMWDQSKGYDFKVAATSLPPSVERLFDGALPEGWSLEWLDAEDGDGAKAQAQSGEIAAYVAFPENFEEEIAVYDPASGAPAPQVEIYYRSADEESLAFYQLFVSALDAYESALANKFDVNAGDEAYDLSGEGELISSVFSGILPFIVIALIFSSCMGVTLESVAGEKERGTLATILVTSVKRRDIALGKVIPLSCIAAIGALSSFLGVALSMPKLMGLSLGGFAASYGFASYLLLFLLIFSVVPLIISAITAVSTCSRSVKEASGYTSVVMILVLVISIVSAFTNVVGGWAVLIPVMNAVVSMQAVLSGSYVLWQALVSVAVNLGYTALLVVLIAKLLGSERIMFGK